MKFFTAVTALLASAVACVSAQSAFIFAPADGEQITRGTNFTVTVSRPVSFLCLQPVRRFTKNVQNQLTPTREVAISLTLSALPNCLKPDPAVVNATDAAPVATVCPSLTQGTVLYAGPFAPNATQVDESGDVITDTGMVWLPPYQNFTFVVPTTIQPGKATLVLNHWALVGVSRASSFLVLCAISHNGTGLRTEPLRGQEHHPYCRVRTTHDKPCILLAMHAKSAYAMHPVHYPCFGL